MLSERRKNGIARGCNEKKVGGGLNEDFAPWACRSLKVDAPVEGSSDENHLPLFPSLPPSEHTETHTQQRKLHTCQVPSPSSSSTLTTQIQLQKEIPQVTLFQTMFFSRWPVIYPGWFSVLPHYNQIPNLVENDGS